VFLVGNATLLPFGREEGVPDALEGFRYLSA
jgi:hypothetical protein